MNTQYKPRFVPVLVAGIGAVFAESATAVPITFSAAGNDAASIQGTVDAFRSFFGPDNGSAVGSQPTGRREITWGNSAFSVTVPGSLTTFANRGAVLTTPGTGFVLSGTEFGEINPTYSFDTFSAPRLLAPLGSTLIDVLFNVPGTTDSAVTRGFGAVFSDVDLNATTSLSLFDSANNLLGTSFAQRFDGGLSFLGVYFTDPLELIARVRINVGNASVGPSNDGDFLGRDIVALDDFIFGEPTAAGTTLPPTTSVPEPTTLALFGLGLMGVGFARRRRALTDAAKSLVTSR